jgi:tellurite resistance-related uncharacterized protein
VTARLPPDVVAYRRTPVFTETTVPAGLLRRHRTKAGTWALILVLEGRLRFRRLDPLVESELDPAHLGIVAPEEPHEVEPLGRVRFFVEFHAKPTQDTASPHH